MKVLFGILILVAPCLGFAQDDWATFDNIDKIRGSKYQWHIQVKTQSPKPEIKRKIRRHSFWNRIFHTKFTLSRPMIIWSFKVNRADTLIFLLSKKRIPGQPINFSGKLRILYYASGFGAPRALNLNIENQDSIKLDYYFIKGLIDKQHEYEWEGNRFFISIYDISLTGPAGSSEKRLLKPSGLDFRFSEREE